MEQPIENIDEALIDNRFVYRAQPSLSKQSIAAFRLLAREGKMMQSKQIANYLQIDQHSVYRIMQPLHERGMIRSGKIFRRVYAAVPAVHARAQYVGHAGREFDRLFGDVYAEKRRET